MSKSMWVNGFRAEILSEAYYAVLRNAEEVRAKTVYEGKASPSREQRAQFLRSAEAEGFNEVVVERNLYVKYTLRSVMSSRSGSLVFLTTFKKDAAGKWVAKRSTRRSIY